MESDTKDMAQYLIARALKEFEGMGRKSHLQVVVDQSCPLICASGMLAASVTDHVAVLTTDGDLRATWGDDPKGCSVAFFTREEAEAFLRTAETTWPGILGELAGRGRNSHR